MYCTHLQSQTFISKDVQESSRPYLSFLVFLNFPNSWKWSIFPTPKHILQNHRNNQYIFCCSQETVLAGFFFYFLSISKSCCCSPHNSAIHLFFLTPASPFSDVFEPQRQRNIRKKVSAKPSSWWSQLSWQKKSGRQQKGAQPHQLRVDDHPTPFALTLSSVGGRR